MGDGEKPKKMTEILIDKVDFEKLLGDVKRDYNDTTRQLTNIHNLAVANFNTLSSKFDVLSAEIKLLTLDLATRELQNK